MNSILTQTAQVASLTGILLFGGCHTVKESTLDEEIPQFRQDSSLEKAIDSMDDEIIAKLLEKENQEFMYQSERLRITASVNQESLNISMLLFQTKVPVPYTNLPYKSNSMTRKTTIEYINFHNEKNGKDIIRIATEDKIMPISIINSNGKTVIANHQMKIYKPGPVPTKISENPLQKYNLYNQIINNSELGIIDPNVHPYLTEELRILLFTKHFMQLQLEESQERTEEPVENNNSEVEQRDLVSSLEYDILALKQ